MNRRSFLGGTLGASLLAWPRAVVSAPATQSLKGQFVKLPVGACQARGWIQRQMRVATVRVVSDRGFLFRFKGPRLIQTPN